jgi:nitronate monooxygenase
MAQTLFANKSRVCEQLGIEVPLFCGAMYPCSNPELVAAVSEAGGIGVIQPVSMVFVHGHSYRDGLKYMRSLTQKPLGINILVEKSSKIYEDRMKEWVDIALEEGIRFFVTALGNPSWVKEKARPYGGLVYHDVTHPKWAQKAVDYGVDGLICVNNRAGGHAGTMSPQELVESLAVHGLPLVCAGGVGSSGEFWQALDMGYDAVQMGTRFICTQECKVHPDYKKAIIDAKATDIVMTDKITGVPVAVIATDHIKALGTKAGWLSRLLLKGRKTKHWMRMYYTLISAWKLKKASLKGSSYKDFWQAGKSVEHINRELSVAELFQEFLRRP